MTTLKDYLTSVKGNLALTADDHTRMLTVRAAIELTPGPHAEPVRSLVEQEIANLRRNPLHPNPMSYPDALAASIDRLDLANDQAWRQKVRHTLLDRLIQEAE